MQQCRTIQQMQFMQKIIAAKTEHCSIMQRIWQQHANDNAETKIPMKLKLKERKNTREKRKKKCTQDLCGSVNVNYIHQREQLNYESKSGSRYIKEPLVLSP